MSSGKGSGTVKAFQLQLTQPELEVLEEALDLYCMSIREDWDGHPPPSAKTACMAATEIKQGLERTLARDAA